MQTCITEIPFDFSQKYETVPRPNRRATVYFGTQLISVGCILLKQISIWALPTVPLFAGKSRFFTRNVPLKTFSRLAGLGYDRFHRGLVGLLLLIVYHFLPTIRCKIIININYCPNRNSHIIVAHVVHIDYNKKIPKLS